MKKVIEVLALILLAIGLAELLDLSFYLMNQSDTYLFDLGLVAFGITFVAFGYLGVYAVKLLKPNLETPINQQEKEKLN
jgi:hypothetical protein